VERSWGVLGEGAGRVLITVGTMAPGFFQGTTKLLMVVRLIKPGVMVPTVIMRSRPAPSPRTPQERSTHSCITDRKVQSQPEDGPHIGPKHVVIILL